MTKFVKNLVIFNGIFIPTVIASLLITGWVKSSKNRSYEESRSKGLIVGEKLIKAVEAKFALQGLEYNTPDRIYNSETYYIPVSIMTYEEAQEMYDAISSANNYGFGLMRVANVLFMDSNMENTHWLLQKKAAISQVEIREHRELKYEEKIEIDTNYKRLLYEIGFEDSNNDGLLNQEDHCDLYFSDLNGYHLTQITKGIDIKSYHYANNYSRLKLKYTARNDSIKEEHKIVMFGYYDFELEKFIESTEINNTLSNYLNEIRK